MSIIEAPFDRESELEEWSFANISLFLGDCIFLDKFQLSTSSGKKGVPDGFAFNFSQRDWYVLECELLTHGVWPHIAEQVSRFVVALQNQDTLRKIRDRLFEHILNCQQTSSAASQLETTTERLLQRIELFVEGVQPTVVIFIDDTNQDLDDFAHALEIPTRIYRVKKFFVDGKAEYYSPDKAMPVLETNPDDRGSPGSQEYDVIEQLGGGMLVGGEGRVKCYKLRDGDIVHVKKSKFHERNNYYWYGMSPISFESAKRVGTTHIIFVLGDWGFVVVPVKIIEQYFGHAKTSRNPDNSIRHYHLLISQEPDPKLFWSNETPEYDLTEYCHPFD